MCRGLFLWVKFFDLQTAKINHKYIPNLENDGIIEEKEGICMASVFDVAKYILDRHGAMSAMKLQKLVFYSQAMSMVWDDVPLFDDDFEAWAKGPVCRTLFKAHKGKFMLNNSEFLIPYGADTDNLTAEQKETINAVTDSLADYPPYRLSQMTHSEAPWQDAREGCEDGERCSKVISKDAMESYYAKNW